MDELNHEVQPIQNVEQNNFQFPQFHIQKRLATILFLCLFFLTYGTGAYYMGRQSLQNGTKPSITPTSIVIMPTSKNLQKPIISPNNQYSNTNYPSQIVVSPTIAMTQTAQPTQTQSTCNSDSDCRPSNLIQQYKCLSGKCVLTSQNSLSCTSDSDCPARQGCFLYQCFSGECRPINMCNDE